MPDVTAKIGIWSNNPSLVDIFTQTDAHKNLSFRGYQKSHRTPYVIAVIDLTQDLGDLTQKIISSYDHCRSQNQKFTLILLHGDSVDVEKNLYFSQLLRQLGGITPLHRLVFVKDLYHGDRFAGETWLGKLVLNSLLERKIQVSGKGKNLIYPLSHQDLLVAIQKIMFLAGTAGKEFWLVGDPMTDLDLAYLIKKNLEDDQDSFDVETLGKNTDQPELSPLGNQSRASLNWTPVSDFTSDLKSVIRQATKDRSLLISQLHRQEGTRPKTHSLKLSILKQKITALQKRLHLKPAEKKAVETPRELLKKILEIGLALLAGTYLLLTASYLVFTALSLISLENSLLSMRHDDLNRSVEYLKKSTAYTKAGEINYSLASPLFSKIAPVFHQKNHNLFVFLHYSHSSLENLQQTLFLAEKIYQSVGHDGLEVNYRDTSLALSSNLGQVYENLTQIGLLTRDGLLPTILEKKLKESPEFENLAVLETQISSLLKSIDMIPAFLGGDSYKNILILFQNSTELRSTGGALDYLLALVVDHGRIVSRHLYNSSEIDDLLTKSPTPPPLISLYTGSDRWKTRDLNYNPNFPATAANFATVIEMSLKFKPDIIVAVNESFLTGLLRETQSVILDGQVTTADLLEKEIKLLSPSPTYLKLINYYLDQILTQKISLSSLGRVLAQQTIENQVLLWMQDDLLEENILNRPYSGGVYHHTCHPSLVGSGSCLAETTYLNESNFSLVPVGKDLQKKIIHRVSFSEEAVHHEYLVDYIFANPFLNLNRDLSQIIQIYAPVGSSLPQVQLNGQSISPNSILATKENSLDRYQIPVALIFNTANQLKISFSTRLPAKLSLPFAYSLTEYRQPGVQSADGGIQLQVVTPSSARAALITAPAISTPDGYQYLFPPQTTTFGLLFEPKRK